jgi:hypothetical protein
LSCHLVLFGKSALEARYATVPRRTTPARENAEVLVKTAEKSDILAERTSTLETTVK